MSALNASLPRVDKSRMSEQIASILRREILAGRLNPGDSLPPERQLADRFGTNRNTLREATRLLQAQGLVKAQQGSGVTVRDYRMHGELPLIPHILEEGGDPAERLAALRELLPIRGFCAARAAFLAARNVTPEALSGLRRLVERQRAILAGELDSGDTLLENDLAIYRMLVDCSSSLVARLVFNTFSRIYFTIIDLFPGLWYTPPNYLEFLEELVGHVASGRAAEAEQVVRDYLSGVDQLLDGFLAQGGPEILETLWNTPLL